MEFLILWEHRDLFTKLGKLIDWHASVEYFAVLLWVLDGVPLLGGPLLSLVGDGLALFVSLFERSPGPGVDFVESSFFDTFFQELLSIELSDWLHALDDGVHERLGEHWLVELVVPKLAESDEVDNHIILEFLSVLGCNPEDAHDVLHALAVDVEDGGIDCFSDVGAVVSGSLPIWGCGETHLVVDHYVHSASNPVIVQLCHLQALKYDTLSSHRCISVHNDRHNLRACLRIAATVVLLSSCSAANNRVDSL
jgi:hypothetical protein